MKNQTQSSNDHVTLFHFEAAGHPNLNLRSLLVGTSLKVWFHTIYLVQIIVWRKNINPHHWITCSYIIHADSVRVVWTNVLSNVMSSQWCFRNPSGRENHQHVHHKLMPILMSFWNQERLRCFFGARDECWGDYLGWTTSHRWWFQKTQYKLGSLPHNELGRFHITHHLCRKSISFCEIQLQYFQQMFGPSVGFMQQLEKLQLDLCNRCVLPKTSRSLVPKRNEILLTFLFAYHFMGPWKTWFGNQLTSTMVIGI